MAVCRGLVCDRSRSVIPLAWSLVEVREGVRSEDSFPSLLLFSVLETLETFQAGVFFLSDVACMMSRDSGLGERGCI